jgi:ferrous iron transport protein B
VYSVGDAADDTTPLREQMAAEKWPDGRRVFTPLVAIGLMVFYVLACQCVSTVAVVKRETNSWRWPLFMFGYMTVLAYVAALLVYQVGTALGWGTA